MFAFKNIIVGVWPFPSLARPMAPRWIIRNLPYTMDTLGTPPHLKPHFEGSAKLTFNHEKEITHMESAENEKVELVLRIILQVPRG